MKKQQGPSNPMDFSGKNVSSGTVKKANPGQTDQGTKKKPLNHMTKR